MVHEIDSKNEGLLLPASFTVKLGLVFLRGFYFKANRKNIGSFKNGTSPPFERSACCYVTISGNFELFQYFNFEIDFLKNENLFEKTGVALLVESTKIENA